MTHSPIEIYKPQLLSLQSVTSPGLKATRGAGVFDLTLRSSMNGQTYRLTLHGPYEGPRPIGEAELRLRFSADYALLSVSFDRRSVDFWGQNTGFLSSINCDACELVAMPPNK